MSSQLTLILLSLLDLGYSCQLLNPLVLLSYGILVSILWKQVTVLIWKGGRIAVYLRLLLVHLSHHLCIRVENSSHFIHSQEILLNLLPGIPYPNILFDNSIYRKILKLIWKALRVLRIGICYRILLYFLHKGVQVIKILVLPNSITLYSLETSYLSLSC